MKTIVNIVVFIFVLMNVILLFSGYLDLQGVISSVFLILLFTIIAVFNNEKQN